MDYFIPVLLTILGVAILVAALKAALGLDKKQHRRSDGGSGIGIGYSHTSKRDNDNDLDGDSGGDGGGGD